MGDTSRAGTIKIKTENRSIIIELEDKKILNDTFDQQILWIIARMNSGRMSSAGLKRSMRRMSPDMDQTKMHTLRYRISKLTNRDKLIRRSKRRMDCRRLFFELTDLGKIVSDLLPEKFDDLLSPDEKRTGIIPMIEKPDKLGGDMPSMSSIKLESEIGPPLYIPSNLPVLADMISMLDEFVLNRDYFVGICGMAPMIYFFYTTHPCIGFKTWMMHEWIRLIDTHTRYFDLKSKELGSYKLVENTRKKYATLIDEKNISDVLLGKSPEILNRNQISNQFSIWHRAPYRFGKSPNSLWGEFLKRVFPHFYRVIHITSEYDDNFYDGSGLPDYSLGYMAGDPTSLLVAVSIRELYYMIREHIRIADFRTISTSQIVRSQEFLHPGKIVFNTIYSLISKTASETLSGSWYKFRTKVEKVSVPGASSMLTGMPPIGENGACST